MALAARPVVLELLAASINVARRAGGIIRDVLSSGELRTVDKVRRRLPSLPTVTAVTAVTTTTAAAAGKADRRAQHCIIESLRRRWPALAIIGEEGAIGGSEHDVVAEVLDAADQGVIDAILTERSGGCPSTLQKATLDQISVWVDPLDGTKEFTEGFPENVTVLIGIAINGTPEAGVIHQPFFKAANSVTGRTIWAAHGLGVHGTEVKWRNVARDGRIVATTRSHPSPAIERALAAAQPASIVRIGGAGNKIVHILDGDFDAYLFPSPGTSKWDTCAGEAILRAAGGHLTDQSGASYDYSAKAELANARGVVASLSDHAFYLSCTKPPAQL
ncbi:bisphosphate nucleotidase 1 [Capsaspora owczarzaki ATCC 30864]|uniref:3'(2'),5'-bisphosphate nucleotidase 1 n=1 Tax=Capsaspora owczarzaki (strain ATCC 30864) TaxID=595528 RepID=A0A0D2X239_CAPO3|nr:bisphosphate nucleotidase 1 [Capsaspora owczarzaki ATCC 30864]KJE91889.1 bisphosphate nucleotidase 1 [Capsaspora owczarzaki ATCC 30864]|eukprot:XP_004363792.2 bisphosphate nucleotidase 1 [Capsaspora owczarzaki ATCC 30864]